MAYTDKIIPRDQIRAVVDRLHAEGKTVEKKKSKKSGAAEESGRAEGAAE